MKRPKIKYFKYLFLVLSVVLFLTAKAQANIVLKVMAVNPSKEQAQKVSVKAYLPKEAKPEDVIDKGDLEIAYDTQQGSYYVYGDYELKPQEVLERDVEMHDIWIIPSTEIESLRFEALKVAGMLKNTEFADRVAFITNNIESKLNQIIENQKSTPPNPERHISDYRDNLKILESVKADLALARSMLSQAKPIPTIVVWRLLIAIIIFLGLLGGSFYFIWQRQVKVVTQDTFYIPKDESSAARPKHHEAKDEEKGKGVDIEDIIKKKE